MRSRRPAHCFAPRHISGKIDEARWLRLHIERLKRRANDLKTEIGRAERRLDEIRPPKKE